MRKKLIMLALIVVVALGGWLAYYFSDTEVIKRQLAELAVELSKEGKETPVQMALKLRTVKEMLAPSCQVTLADSDHVEELERDMIIQYLIYYRQRYVALRVHFAAVEVDIPAKGEATVQTEVHLYRTRTAGLDTPPEQHPVEIFLDQDEDMWLIQAVNMPDALTR